jgi:hypothetical protein
MNWNEYTSCFEEILHGKVTNAPYDDPHFLEYTKLNHSRMIRWLKQGKINEQLIEEIKKISNPQDWVLITEPWCGDAAHIVPFINMLSEMNPLIKLDLQLRDSPGSEIDQYLTNGGKSVPKLIIRNVDHIDLLVWGPRPQAAQQVFMDAKAQGLEIEQQKMALQQWYNTDKGVSLQEELLQFFNSN